MDKLGKIRPTLLEKAAPLNNEDITPQNREISQTIVWWGAKVCKFSRLCRAILFARLRRITFQLGNCVNFKARFSVFLTDFP